MFGLRIARLAVIALCLVSILGSSAWAHPGHAGHEFVDGWSHPISGLDHLLAMVAVGLLAVRMGGPALWAMPMAFLAAMLTGGLAAAAGLAMPGVEYGIMASVLVLGLLVAATRIAPLAVGAGLVALFAFFHGYAHAAEMASGGSLGAYALGFLLATAVLHAGGIVLGLLVCRWLNVGTLRAAGGAIGAAGALMFVGLI